MHYDYITVNLFPVVGSIFLVLFLVRNSRLEKNIRHNFYILAGISLIELMVYNMELYLTTVRGYTMLLTLATAVGYSLRIFLMYFFTITIIRDEKYKRFRLPLMIPALVGVAYTIISIVFNGELTFFYDEDGGFHRGILGWTPYIIIAVYLVFMIVLSILVAKKRRFESVVIFECTIVILLGAAGEGFFGCYALLRICSVSALLFYYMFFQSEVYKDYILEKHIEQAQTSKKLTIEMITALAKTIDAKDKYTNGHSERVAEYSMELAIKMGKPTEFQQDIYYMGLLHDIGKIGIPDSIINKEGKLTDEEFNLIKSHPIIGSDMLKDITIKPHLYYGARWHHERYDGKGYPDNLYGDDIPIEAQIISIVDTFDALVSDKVQRDGYSFDQAFSMITRGECGVFSEDILAAFTKSRSLIEKTDEYVEKK